MDSKKIRVLTIEGMLVALMFVLGLTPIGNVSFGTVNITLMAYPVIIGTLMLGRNAGLLLGFLFGAINFFKTFIMPSPLTAPLLFQPMHWYGPVLYAVLMLLPRILVPMTVYGVNRLPVRQSALRYGIASVCGCLTNTVLFLGLMYVFFVQDISRNYSLPAAGVAAMLLGIAASNGVVEALVSLVCSPVVMALKKAFGELEQNT